MGGPFLKVWFRPGTKLTKGLFFLIVLPIMIFNLAIFSGIMYLTIHFITKYW